MADTRDYGFGTDARHTAAEQKLHRVREYRQIARNMRDTARRFAFDEPRLSLLRLAESYELMARSLESPSRSH